MEIWTIRVRTLRSRQDTTATHTLDQIDITNELCLFVDELMNDPGGDKVVNMLNV